MSDVDTMSELHIQRVGPIDDTSSMGGQSFLEINNLDGKSSGGGSFMVVGGNQSESSYTGTETGVVKVGGQKQDWESSSDYTDVQITGGQQFDLNSSFVSETSVQMGEIPSIRQNNSTRLESFQEGDSDEEDFDSLKESEEERARREQKQAALKPSVYVHNGKSQ